MGGSAFPVPLGCLDLSHCIIHLASLLLHRATVRGNQFASGRKEFIIKFQTVLILLSPCKYPAFQTGAPSLGVTSISCCAIVLQSAHSSCSVPWCLVTMLLISVSIPISSISILQPIPTLNSITSIATSWARPTFCRSSSKSNTAQSTPRKH